MKSKQNVLLLGLACVLFFAVFLFVYFNFYFGKYIKEVVLGENILISSEWKNINSQKLIKADKEINYISILLEPPFEADTPKNGIKDADGKIINPEIKLIDENGKEYLLNYSGSRRYENSNYANYSCDEGLPTGKIYEKVLFRSDFPIKAQKVIWSGYDVKDLK